MSSREERSVAAIRHVLSRYPRPELTADFSSGVVDRVRERERALQQERRPSARLVLGAYWLAAALASAWILVRLPLPEWIAPVVWGLGLVAVPVMYAIALFPERAGA
jgi:hypothetical protein